MSVMIVVLSIASGKVSVLLVRLGTLYQEFSWEILLLLPLM
tara:strand:+ start:580 stop:702 length:123 start_codon:yes stop_codon:yes gene_type:complete